MLNIQQKILKNIDMNERICYDVSKLQRTQKAYKTLTVKNTTLRLLVAVIRQQHAPKPNPMRI